MAEENPSEGWHLRKEVNFGHIITTGGLLVTALWWSSKIDSRMVAIEKSQTRIISVLEKHQEKPAHDGQSVAFAVFEAKVTGQLDELSRTLAGMEARITADINQNSTRIDRQWEIINEINEKLRKAQP